MKRALIALWLILPVAAYAYHMGPGQDLMRLDQAAALIESADLHVAEAQRIAADESIAELTDGLNEAATERARILCLVRLTATGEVLSPLEVTERCP